jgi:hypothetical protein
MEREIFARIFLSSFLLGSLEKKTVAKVRSDFQVDNAIVCGCALEKKLLCGRIPVGWFLVALPKSDFTSAET